tara:strand:- start:67 stop:1155 length:1089 start_codon:yes stop_codon:yes gene_type:complete
MRRRVPLSLILTRGVRFTRRRRTRANMNTPMRLAMVALSIAALAVVANAANVTGDAVLTFSDLSFDDVLQQLVKAESLVHAKMTAGWSYILDNFSHFVIAGPLTFVFHEVVYFSAWTPWLLMDQFDYCKRWKIQPDKKADGKMVLKCLKRLLLSHVFIQLPMQLLFHWVAQFFGFSMALPLPPVRDLAWQLPVFFAIEDFYFYWIHRFLHHKSVYKYVHKIHHEHTHPFGIAAEYAHPVETFFLGIGTLLGPLIFAKHMVTLWAWLTVRLFETVEDHSGYDLPFNPTNFIPFWGGAVHHDFHHKTFKGPYASIFTWCDFLFGTDKEFRAQQLKLREGKEGVYPAQFRGAPHEKALEGKAKAA